MLTAVHGSSVRLLDGELLRRRRTNRDYMMSLSDDNLLMNFRLEAGLFSADQFRRMLMAVGNHLSASSADISPATG